MSNCIGNKAFTRHMNLALVYKRVVDSTCMSKIVCSVTHSSVKNTGCMHRS